MIASFGLNAFFGKAALGLVQAFCFNWIYFELDGADLFTHAIRRNVTSGKSFVEAFLGQCANKDLQQWLGAPSTSPSL
jgi:hypothetical protein